MRSMRNLEYLGSRGLSGLQELSAGVAKAKRDKARWVRSIPMHGAVQNGHITTASYLAECVRVRTSTRNEDGNTALHHAIIWGQTDCVVYLLHRGMSVHHKNAAGTSVLALAKVRQRKLESDEGECADVRAMRFANKEDRERVRVEGVALLEILEGVEAAGSYSAWAQANTAHKLVAFHSPGLVATAFRQCPPARRRRRRSALGALH